MTNFNTYQTRHFYVAGAIDESVDTNLDIALEKTADNEYFFFKYKNADGLVTRSDLINPAWIRSVKKTAAADMDRPLMAHTVSVDTNAVTLSDLVGKTVTITINFQEFIDYSPNSGFPVSASFIGNTTNTANATAFHKALAYAIAQALPAKNPPLLKVFSNGSEVTKSTAESSVTGAAAGVVLVEAAQKYVRGKLNGDPIPFTVSFNTHGKDVEGLAWGKDVTAKSAISGNTIVPAVYTVADLEYFALGERGDVYRGSIWPNNYEPTYAVDLSKDYDILTIEFYWQGTAENVQKSPRMIQIAAESGGSSAGVVDNLYDSVQAIMAGISES